MARLYTETGFLKRLDAQFEGDWKLRFHLAPPLLAQPDPATGEPRKRAYGPWMLHAMRRLAGWRRWRNSWLDPFRYTEDRRVELQMVADYARLMDEVLGKVDAATHATAVELAALPLQVRGFGPVKLRHLAHAKRREQELLRAFRSRSTPQAPAGERGAPVAVIAG